MRRHRLQLSTCAAAAVAALGLTAMALAGGTTPCVVPDDGTGTVVLPPPGCEYLSPTEFHEIVDGLPPGTTIILEPIHADFLCNDPVGGNECGMPGGPLGGELETFDSVVIFQMTGTGDLKGFNRVIELNVQCQTATGPRNPGDAVQTFDTEMVSMNGALPPGDPDFAELIVVAGLNNGMPSPGSTTLTRLGPPGSDFQVDSFFDISYEISFVGAPGGALDGLAGTTPGTVVMEASGGPPLVPTVSEWGLIVMGLLLLTGGTLVIRRKTQPALA
jgi:hypothetical protein